MGEPRNGKGLVDLVPGERAYQGRYALDHRAQRGEQQVRSCERHDMDVMAGLQTQQGLRSVAGEALMEGDRLRYEASLGQKPHRTDCQLLDALKSNITYLIHRHNLIQPVHLVRNAGYGLF